MAKVAAQKVDDDAAGNYRRMMSLPNSAKSDIAVIRRQRGLSSDTKAVAKALSTTAKFADLSDDEMLLAVRLWKAIKDIKDEVPGKVRFLVETVRPDNPPVVNRVHVLGL